MSEQRLTEVLESGDTEKCVAFFKGMPEKERRKLAPFCRKWYQKILQNQVVQTGPRTWTTNKLLFPAEAAVFATATCSEIRKRGSGAHPFWRHAFAILMDRRPDWAGQWALTLLDETMYWTNWDLIRQLMAAGVLEKPDHPHYYLGMIGGIAGTRGPAKGDPDIQQCLLDEPDLLEDDVWRLFEYEGGGENSLANYDRFTFGQKWADALTNLMNDGHLCRERLMRCSLEALERDFNHYRAKWFSAYYDSLEPSADELQQHADRFLRLLGVSAPNIVSWAFQKVQKLSRAGAFEHDALISGVEPVLRARQKGIVIKALKLIRQTAAKSSAQESHAAHVAAIALSHESADVQAAALDVIEKFGSPDDARLREAVESHADAVAPSLRSRVDDWLGTGGETEATSAPAEERTSAALEEVADDLDPELCHLYRIDAIREHLAEERMEIPAAVFDGTEIPRLDPAQRVVPITDLDELIEVCSRVIEDDSDVDEAERAIDGIARLCDQRPDDWEQRTAPLRKRALQLLKKDAAPFLGYGPGHDVCGLVHAWCEGIVLRGEPQSDDSWARQVLEIDGEQKLCWTRNLAYPLGVLSQRSLALAVRVAERQATPLLSAPTHSGGWIDSAVLIERVNAVKGYTPDTADVCLALLRLAPDRRDQALKQLRKSTTEWERAIRYAIGARRGSIGKTEALWIAAARARSPWQDDPKVEAAFPDRGPDAGTAAKYAFACRETRANHIDLEITTEPPQPDEVTSDNVTVRFHACRQGRRELQWEMGGLGGRSVGAVRWTASIWPLARDSYFAGAAMEIADNLDWWEAQWQNKAYLEPLLDSGTPLRDMGLLLLALGLAAKEPGESGLATDITIAAIEDGRLGADNLGRMLGELLPTGLIKPGRWQKTLSEVARISPVHALTIQQSVQRALHGEPASMPRDTGRLIEMLRELSIELGQSITDEGCREYLAQIGGSGKAAKAAKALLAIEPTEFARCGRPLMEQVLSQRITAARSRQAMRES